MKKLLFLPVALLLLFSVSAYAQEEKLVKLKSKPEKLVKVKTKPEKNKGIKMKDKHKYKGATRAHQDKSKDWKAKDKRKEDKF